MVGLLTISFALSCSIHSVGSSAQVSAMKFNSSRLRLIQAQFKELEVYSGFSADISAETQTALPCALTSCYWR